MVRPGQAKSFVAPKKNQYETLLFSLNQLLVAVSDLGGKIASIMQATIQAETPDSFMVGREKENLVGDFKRLSEMAVGLKVTLDHKIRDLKSNGGPSSCRGPILASSLQTVMLLHLSSELTMGKRLEELNAQEKKKKEILCQFENGLKITEANFGEVAHRLNLLCYMQSCLEKEGILPANIMYLSSVPQTVISPFAPKVVGRIQPIGRPKEPSVYDNEEVKRELEKKKALLLELREQHRLELAKKFSPK